MSRTGIEAKPAWRDLPASVRTAAAEALGSPVARAMRVWGGYGPTPTFRLRLRDGRRAFFKAVGPDGNEFMHRAIARETRVYRELGGVIAAWAPACLGVLTLPDWQALLLEDLGPKSAPPWTPSLARHVVEGLSAFHAGTAAAALPGWLGPGWTPAWPSGVEVPDPPLRRWLARAAPDLSEATRPPAGARRVLLHRDTRSDNLRWVRGRLYLLDWPHVGAGAPEYDLAGLAQSITVEGGPAPERLAGWYEGADPAALTCASAHLAGYFLANAFLADIPGLPRLRAFQRAQLNVTLAWAARRLDLPPPPRV